MKISGKHLKLPFLKAVCIALHSTVIDLRDSVMIVDPNWLPKEIDDIFEFVQTEHRNKKQFLLFTHSDYDHIIGYGKFRDAVVISTDVLAQSQKKRSSTETNH